MNPQTYSSFLRFKNKEWIDEQEIKLVSDYIYGYLLFDYDSPEMYAYCNVLSKCEIVLRFKKENNFEVKTKVGEVICNNKLVNFIEEPNHQIHKCNWGSTYGWFTIK